MKRMNFKILSFGVLAVLVLTTSCSALKKMKKNANQISYQVVPEVLETSAGSVPVSIQGNFPAKYFNKNVKLTAVPTLNYKNGKTEYESVALQGEKVKDNAQVISFENGGSFSFKGNVPFKEDMRKSDFNICIKASKGLKSINFEPVKIADGVIATATMVVVDPKAILGVQREENTTGKYDPNIDKFQRVVPDEYTSNINYLINSAVIRNSELKKAEIEQLKEYTKEAYDNQKKELKGVDISAYASPDGKLDFNTKLSEKRQNTSSKYIKGALDKESVEAQLNTKFTPEDWDGFKELMEKSDIQDKDLILRVLSMYSDPEVREREIKNISEAYTVLADQILPQLRRAKVTANVDVIGKSDEEITALAESDPSSLNPAELLYAATLTNDHSKKLSIYKSFTKVYPNDWRGFNNYGLVLAQENKYDEAKSYFEKAETLSSDPIIKNNLGTVALFDGNNSSAAEYFGAASGAGEEVNYNIGILAIKNAEYNKAVQLLGNSDSSNAGLSKMLDNDNTGALKSLESISENTAVAEYLKAVIAARTAKEDLMISSLTKAISMDSNLKAKASTDAEFTKYANNAKFMEIVK